MITHVHIQNFKCFKDFEIDLDPFTVLIGPNDSGKTAFLQAMYLPGCGHWFDMERGEAGIVLNSGEILPDDREMPFRWSPNDIWQRRWEPRNTLDSDGDHITMAFSICRSDDGIHVLQLRSSNGREYEAQQPDGGWAGNVFEKGDLLPPTAYYRLSPALLRRPSNLLLDPSRIPHTGEGLPAALLPLGSDDPERYSLLQDSFRERFPQYRRFIPTSEDYKAVLYFQTRSMRLPATSVSDGVMLSLAFLTIAALPNPPQLLLIEEPENGVHHESLKDIVKTLRGLVDQHGTQVILTTHSPYLLDLVEPERVRVFAKDDEGAVHARKMSEDEDVERKRKHFFTGEIWAGLSEKELVLGKLGDE